MAKPTRLRIWSLFNADDVSMLRTPGQPMSLDQLDQPEMQQRIDDMLLTMRKAEGIGLAAPQIGQSLRLAVIDRAVDDVLTDDLVMMNPTWQPIGANQENGEEGCLSIPKVFGMVSRHFAIRLTYFDRHGQQQSLDARGLLARVIQHECDHLNGVLFIDHATSYTKGQELLP